MNLVPGVCDNLVGGAAAWAFFRKGEDDALDVPVWETARCNALSRSRHFSTQHASTDGRR